MKKIFLDLGSNRLQGLYNIFKDKLGIDEKWVIRCFEANKSVYEHALREINHFRHNHYIFFQHPDFEIHNVAISDKCGVEKIKNIIEYSVDNGKILEGDAGGSTLLDNAVWNLTNVKFETTEVVSIDINILIDQLVQKYGHEIEIFIKCDIEGYEYKVIKRLLSSKHLDKIRTVYIEWHPHMFEDKEAKKIEAFDLMRELFIPKGKLDVCLHY